MYLKNIVTLLTIAVVSFLASCKKTELLTHSPVIDQDDAKEWLEKNGKAYKTGQIALEAKDGQALKGALNWEKATRYNWSGKNYIDIPFEFDGQIIVPSYSGSGFLSCNMVIRENGDNFEAAVRFTEKNAYSELATGTKANPVLQTYQSLTGDILNAWARGADLQNFAVERLDVTLKEFQQIRSAQSKTTTVNRSTVVCDAFPYTYYVWRCPWGEDISTEQEQMSPFVCVRTPMTAFYTVCRTIPTTPPGGWPPTQPINPIKDCLTLSNLRNAFGTEPTDAKLQEIADMIKEYANDLGIDTKAELEHLLTQMGHETENFTRLEENKKFRVSKLSNTWGRLFNPTSNPTANPNKANPNDFAESPNSIWADQQKLLNFVYGFANNPGLGNDQPGDGYRYRGRGGMHLTGKYLYGLFTTFYSGYCNGSCTNFVQQPELLGSNTEAAILSGMWYFSEMVAKKMNINSGTSVEAVAKKINPRETDFSARKTLFDKVKQALAGC